MRLCYLADARSIHTLRWIRPFSVDNEIDLISFDYAGVWSTAVTLADYHAIGVRVHLVPRHLPGLLLVPFIVRNLVRSLGPDLVHAHYLTQYGFCAAFAGVHPLVVSAWGNDILIDPVESRIYRFMVEYALRRADLVTCDGENYLPYLQSSFGVEPSRIAVITHGVDTERFSPVHRDRAFVEGLFSGPVGAIVIDIRGFDPIYDLETLLRAMPGVLAHAPDTRFLIAGRGERKADFERLAADLGVLDAILFIDWIRHEDLPVYLASADIYVSTSVSDGGAVVSTLEAMASGLPLVVTDVGDHRRLIREGEIGFVVPVGDHGAIERAIIHLLDHPETRLAFGRVSAERIRQLADYRIEMTKVRSHYEQLIKKDTS